MTVCVCLQLRDQHIGADGSRGLYDRIPEWSYPPQKNARPWLAEKMLSDDWQKVFPFQLHLLCDHIMILWEIKHGKRICSSPEWKWTPSWTLTHLTYDVLSCLQAQEEFEILHYSPSIMVYQDGSSHYQALHQVKMTSHDLMCSFPNYSWVKTL